MGWSLQLLGTAFPVKDSDVKLCMFQFDDFHQAGRGRELKGDAITGNRCSIVMCFSFRALASHLQEIAGIFISPFP